MQDIGFFATAAFAVEYAEKFARGNRIATEDVRQQVLDLIQVESCHQLPLCF